MDKKKLSNLTDQEILDKKKKLKSNQIISAVLIGFLVGIAVYSTVNKGLGFFTFFPLFFIFLIAKNKSDLNTINLEMKNRNLD
ncbi:hypothetical protein [Sphingobacterium sp. BN32]|uniref:hypothetical protein n=1 Tax=Sphingobacterium sp. BN32 TaxID=3058432 RepID=UPI00265D3EC4|nr:hypothetical protein [Sphingobacterium sp. BN32]WKK60227.1 hypothetical protein QYC40_08275 [Sphingobacterium sp. BN32]